MTEDHDARPDIYGVPGSDRSELVEKSRPRVAPGSATKLQP